jgi:hypothetical protein
MQMRKQIKKPLTERAKKLSLQLLDQFRQQGHDPNEILDQSTMRCWSGLFPVDKKKQPERMDTTSAWMEFRACIRDNRMPREPMLVALVKTFGGLNRLGELTTWDIENRIRKDFDASYRLAKAH